MQAVKEEEEIGVDSGEFVHGKCYLLCFEDCKNTIFPVNLNKLSKKPYLCNIVLKASFPASI